MNKLSIPTVKDRRIEAIELPQPKRGVYQYEYKGVVHTLISLPKKKEFLDSVAEDNKKVFEDMMIEQRELYAFGKSGATDFVEVVQNSLEWDMMRYGSTGASSLPIDKNGKVSDEMILKYPARKAFELLYAENQDKEFLYLHREMENTENFWMKRGHELEPLIQKAFMSSHLDLEVTEDGIMRNKLFDLVHFSPDGILMNFLSIVAILEIKALQGEDFIRARRNPEYLVAKHNKQLQMGMWLTDTDKAYLVGGIERGVNNRGIAQVATVEIEVMRDEEFIYNLVQSLNILLPLITKDYLANQDIF
jgi:hypothetical protein